MSSISQSQRSTLLSASLLHTDWLNPVRSLARGGGEEASGEGEGEGGGLLFTEGVDEHENDNAERESRGEDTPFLFDLRPSPAAEEGEERGGTGGDGRTGDGPPPGCVTLSYFPPGARIMPEWQRSPAELPRLFEEAQD